MLKGVKEKLEIISSRKKLFKRSTELENNWNSKHKNNKDKN